MVCAILSAVAHVVAAEGFLTRYLSGPLPYGRRHITVNKMLPLDDVIRPQHTEAIS